MKPKYTITTTHRMDYDDFDKLVKSTYGKDFEVVADQECGNDESLSFTGVRGEMDEYDLEDLQKFQNTGRYCFLGSRIMEDLVRQGILPAGDWLIDVSW